MPGDEEEHEEPQRGGGTHGGDRRTTQRCQHVSHVRLPVLITVSHTSVAALTPAAWGGRWHHGSRSGNQRPRRVEQVLQTEQQTLSSADHTHSQTHTPETELKPHGTRGSNFTILFLSLLGNFFLFFSFLFKPGLFGDRRRVRAVIPENTRQRVAAGAASPAPSGWRSGRSRPGFTSLELKPPL